MKILLANSNFGGGGITTYAHELIENFSKTHELSVMIGDDSKAPITVPGVKIYRYDCSNLSVENAKTIIQVINEEIKPDIVLASAARIIPAVAPYIDDDIKVITVGHSGKYFDSEYSTINHQYLDLIIGASSLYNKEYLKNRFHIADQKIKVVYNFETEYPNSNEIREQKKHSETITIVFAGAAGADKGAEIVLKVLLKLIKTDWPFKFYWIGNPVVPLSSYLSFFGLKNVMQLVPNDNRVEFTGRISSREELLNIVSKSNVYFAPSKNEGSSMALIEALRVGCIALVSDYPNSNREVIEYKEAGFVIPHKDIDQFVNKIGNIIHHHDQYAAYYDNAYQTYRDLLNYDVWTRNINDTVINTPLSHKPRIKHYDDSMIKRQLARMKRLKKRCQVEKSLELSLKTYFSMWKVFAGNWFKSVGCK